MEISRAACLAQHILFWWLQNSSKLPLSTGAGLVRTCQVVRRPAASAPLPSLPSFPRRREPHFSNICRASKWDSRLRGNDGYWLVAVLRNPDASDSSRQIKSGLVRLMRIAFIGCVYFR
jgi:hypothetical protein